MRSVITFSSPLWFSPLPPRRLISFVLCVLLQCYWNIKIPPVWSAFCLEFTLSDVDRADLHPSPPPAWLLSCLHLTEVSYFQVIFNWNLKLFLRLFCFLPTYVCLFYRVATGSYFAFSTSGCVVGTVTLMKSCTVVVAALWDIAGCEPVTAALWAAVAAGPAFCDDESPCRRRLWANPLYTSWLLLVCIPHWPKRRGSCLVLLAYCPVPSRWF